MSNKISQLIWIIGVAKRAGLLDKFPKGYKKAANRRAKGWGTSLGGITAKNAELYPNRIGLNDDLGDLTFVEMQNRSNALAHEFLKGGIKSGNTVAIMCRNHRYFVDAMVATAKVGAHTVYLNTEFSGPQLQELLQTETPDLLVCDDEFRELFPELTSRVITAWPAPGAASEIDEIVAAGNAADLPVPTGSPEQVILTSGTTGKPKGARRGPSKSAEVAMSVLERVPMRRGENHYVAAPLFHTWGNGNFAMAQIMGARVIIRRKFSETQALEILETQDPETVIMVPIMAQRMLQVVKQRGKLPVLKNLRCVVLSGSALPQGFATEFMDTFGDVLYVAYGSTEVGAATYGDPAELRQDPGTAGSVLRSTKLAIFDEDGNKCGPNQRGLIYVGNVWQVEKFTGGGRPDVKAGLMSTGDWGYLTEAGLLHVNGRGSDMIVSGGENVFPREVEDLLIGHPQVEEVAVVGTADAEFGQRLVAFVVPAAGDQLSAAEVQEYVRANLARYKVPRDVHFLEQLPRNITGKILHRVLREQIS